MTVDPVAAAGFAAAADAYERARPSYPLEAVEWLAARTGLGPGSVVADVGAGTGKLTRLLTATGARVVAVEPIDEMRAKISGVEVVAATAEELPFDDGSIDVVTVAQAFHWFDHERALPELHRVLRGGGFLALFWNMRDLRDPLQKGVEDLLAPLRQQIASHESGAWRVPLAASGLFGDAQVREFRHEQRFTADDLVDRVASTSFVAALGEAPRAELLARARALAAGRDEPFPFPYVTEVHLLPRTSDRAAGEGGTSNKGWRPRAGSPTT
ncbi:MAG TPA: class I SAM-dependent methyltransferase [Gaiellaceae bacterium]|nr:class I SAM-dependent methyltransferase [Gaiellaceae bacterium]